MLYCSKYVQVLAKVQPEIQPEIVSNDEEMLAIISLAALKSCSMCGVAFDAVTSNVSARGREILNTLQDGRQRRPLENEFLAFLNNSLFRELHSKCSNYIFRSKMLCSFCV